MTPRSIRMPPPTGGTVEAFRARDLDTVRSLIAEDVVWHVPGRHSMAGDPRPR